MTDDGIYKHHYRWQGEIHNSSILKLRSILQQNTENKNWVTS